MKTALITFILAVTIPASIPAVPYHFQSNAKQVSLVELYTSEGCSSCPPAEEWMNRLKNSPELWKNFVPVEFHVDYWNSLGWKDHWSAPEYTKRQSDYAQLWHAENVYTPCFVLNGNEWLGWRTRSDTPGALGEDVGVLEARSLGTNLWSATFVPAHPGPDKWEIHAVLLSGGLDSDVKAGENRGRHLHHEFAALDLMNIGMASTNGIAHGKFILDTSRYPSEKSLALAVWVTRPGELVPVQATGGWLASQ